MNVNVKLVLTDEDLRRIRATTGRGGVATRSECRIWLSRVMEVALKNAPEPKRRRVAQPPVERPAPTRAPQVAAQPVTDETRCAHCKRQRDSHGKMMLTCLPGFGAPVGSRFSPAGG